MTIHDAVTACLTEWAANGQPDFGNWRDQIDTLVQEACDSWAQDHMPVTVDMQNTFDYSHGGWESVEGRDLTATWLRQLGHEVTPEDSGDLYRLYVEDIAGYYWPEDANSWWNAV